LGKHGKPSNYLFSVDAGKCVAPRVKYLEEDPSEGNLFNSLKVWIVDRAEDI
jgi:hypothetical protein